MKVTVLHNPKSGNGDISPDDFKNAFAEVGYKAQYQSTKEKGFHHVLEQPTDLIAVAGGDGTLRKVFRHLTDLSDIPVLLLSMGTANNIASSIGVYDDWKQRIQKLKTLAPRPFYFGEVRCGKQEDFFFESVGIGIFADFLRLIEQEPWRIEQMVADGPGYSGTYKFLAKLADAAPVLNMSVKAEGEKVDKELLWLEVLNIPSIGPHLQFYPREKDQHQVEFHLVEADKKERPDVMSWFKGNLKGKTGFSTRSVPSVPGVKLSGKFRTLHIDDEFREFEVKGDEDIKLEIKRVDRPLMIMR